MNNKNRKVLNIIQGSPCDGLGISPGDYLISVNGEPVEDIFDYQYLTLDEELDLGLERDGSRFTVHITKDADEDPGLEFEKGLMDDYRHCTNKCVFCFIDQNPPGMRETLYFKDDDSRLSFLQGNYVTLTNMSDHDIDRICKYHLSPINISFHTTDPQLRCMMLGNRFAGEALKKVDRLNEADITMNGQIVLCKGLNDGEQLNKTISDLTAYIPNLQSVSVVPVGLTRFREGLYPLEPFEKEDALSTLEIIHRWQDRLYEKYGTHFVHASDEWYILAGVDLPAEDRYDGYPQLENGVGKVRLLLDETKDALSRTRFLIKPHGHVSIVSGMLTYEYMQGIADNIMNRYHGLKISVYPIINKFFGERITVTGLITGGDLIEQLRGRDLGSTLFLQECMLRAGEDYFLDDVTLDQVRHTLQANVEIVKSSGYDLVNKLTGSGLRVSRRIES